MKANRNVFYSLVAMNPNPKTEIKCGCCSKYLDGMFAYEPVKAAPQRDGSNKVEPVGKDVCEVCAKKDMQNRLESSMDLRATIGAHQRGLTAEQLEALAQPETK